MIDLNTKEVIFIMKIIDLDAEIFIKKTIIAVIFKIDSNIIYIVIILINQDTTMLFYIFALGFEIMS